MVTAHILECLPDSKTFSRHPGGTLFSMTEILLWVLKKGRRKTFEGSVSAGFCFLDTELPRLWKILVIIE